MSTGVTGITGPRRPIGSSCQRMVRFTFRTALAQAPRRLCVGSSHPSDAKFAAVGSGPLLDVKLSDDGTQAFWVWDNEVCSCAVGAESDASTPHRLTFGARGTGMTNGVADYCAQEEMSRYTGYWPSPGEGKSVAFEEVDESHIPEFTIRNWACPIRTATTRPTATHLPGPPIPR